MILNFEQDCMKMELDSSARINRFNFVIHMSDAYHPMYDTPLYRDTKYVNDK